MSVSNLVFAFFSTRFAVIRDCFSLVSIMIGIFGFGHLIISFAAGDFEKMSSMVFGVSMIYILV